MLRKIEAEQMVLSALGAGGGAVAIAADRTIERAFGWLFVLTLKESPNAARGSSRAPRQVIVNRYSSQIVASSIEYAPEQFIKIYEELLAQHEAHEGAIRLTTSSAGQWRQWWERRVARRAVQAGLYQIGAD